MTTEQNKPNTLFAKIARIMGEVGRLEKDADHAYPKYKYTSDNVVFTAVQEKLSNAGVALFSSIVDVHQEQIEAKDNKKTWKTRAKFEFVLADSETGETITCTWYSEAIGNDDKGINKCATAALKYWLLKTFIVPTGDDPDASSPPPARRQQSPNPPQKRTAGPPVADSGTTDTNTPAIDLHAQHLEGLFTQLAKNVGKALNIDAQIARAGINKHLEAGNINEDMTGQQMYDWILAEAERKAALKALNPKAT